MGNDVQNEFGGETLTIVAIPTTRADGEAIRALFGKMGLRCETPSGIEEMSRSKRSDDGVAALLLSEEALIEGAETLGGWLRRQPVWSDLPVLVLARTGAESAALGRGLQQAGNYSVVERPIRQSTLVSLVRSALRARVRQYQVRDHLRERERAAEERAALLESERVARAEAERAGRMKDEFLATLSHELRTPMNAILGWTQIMRSESKGSDAVDEGLEVIERNARSQAQIIEDLLDMSRIVSGKVSLVLEEMDLEKVLRSVVDSARPMAAGKGVAIGLRVESKVPSMVGDGSRLQQIVWNLVTNAIKFTPKGGKVEVGLDAGEGYVEVSVKDDGEGISAEFLPNVFDRFRQADASSTRRHGGLGLGLSIVKQLVELHKGTVVAESAGKGKGATFRVKLPERGGREGEGDGVGRARRASAGEPCEGERGGELRGARIVVVDDERDARELMARLLRKCEAVVWAGSSAEEGLQLVREHRPDVLVSDIGMPGRNGYSLMEDVRGLGRDEGGETPGVAVTAYARGEDRARALEAGFEEHLAKPVSAAALVRVVAGIVGRGK